MVRIEDKMAEFVGKFMRVELKDNTEFELSPTEGNKRKWLYNYKKLQLAQTKLAKDAKENKLTNEAQEEFNRMSNELYLDDMNELKIVLQKSYPNLTEAQIDNVLQKYDSELLEEIFVWYGWIDDSPGETDRGGQNQRTALFCDPSQLEGICLGACR